MNIFTLQGKEIEKRLEYVVGYFYTHVFVYKSLLSIFRNTVIS